MWEIKLGDDFLMTSAFTISETALADLAMSRLEVAGAPRTFEVVVGGLGLGYTAAAVLDHATVAELIVVDIMDAVIDWHRDGLVPLGPRVSNDPRCRLLQADFFQLAASDGGFDADQPGRRFDAILVDIDHTPEALLATTNATFYSEAGLAALARHLKPGGVFGLWSNDKPDPVFTARLQTAFINVRAEPTTFDNPLQGQPFTQTVYLASTVGRHRMEPD